jgi:hypothetical protein
LVCSAFLLIYSGFSPEGLANWAVRESVDRGYRDFYSSDLPLHVDSLRQGAVFVPVYSITEEDELGSILGSFNMGDADVSYEGEYFLAQAADGSSLKVYRYLNLLEWEAPPCINGLCERPILWDIGNIEAKNIATAFAREHLFLIEPYDTKVEAGGGLVAVTIYEEMGKILNRAFPTRIVLDKQGNVREVSHFYFEYEELGRGDIMSPRAALASLPRDHEGIIRITDCELSYAFINSVLQPAYIFRGLHPDGSMFSYCATALKSY